MPRSSTLLSSIATSPSATAYRSPTGAASTVVTAVLTDGADAGDDAAGAELALAVCVSSEASIRRSTRSLSWVVMSCIRWLNSLASMSDSCSAASLSA